MKQKIINYGLTLIILVSATLLLFFIFSTRIHDSLLTSLVSPNRNQELPAKQQHIEESQEAKNLKMEYKEQLTANLQQTKNLTGTVTEILDPAVENPDKAFKVLTIQSYLIDSESVDSQLATKETGELPTTKKEFKITVMKNIDFENTSYEQLEAGMLLNISVDKNIYQNQELNALFIALPHTE